MLACYLYSRERANDTDVFVDDEDAMAWLRKVAPKFMKLTAQNQCIEKAIKFLPELVCGLKKHEEEDDDEASGVLEGLFDSVDEY